MRGREWRRALQGGAEAAWAAWCRNAESALVAADVVAVAGDQPKGRPPQTVQAGSAATWWQSKGERRLRRAMSRASDARRTADT
eukprot:11185728-Alexandrium_andersonii.AAC.1